ncbi:MAG: peptidyl-prolyl cis-trans isomerase [Ignavibacteriaceae bacterium]
MKKTIFFLSFNIIFNVLIVAQSVDKQLAKAGNEIITENEFKERYELSPHPRTSNSLDTALVKKEYLYTLIAEKLLAQNARELHIDTTQEIKDIMSYFERMYVRDAYYKIEIKDKLKIPQEKILEGENRFLKILRVNFINDDDENGIRLIYNELKGGASFDSLLVLRPEDSEDQAVFDSVKFGMLPEFLEDTLYALQLGQFTQPIQIANKWYIFKLSDILEVSGPDRIDLLSKVHTIIEDREIKKLQYKFYLKFFTNLKVDVDRNLFDEILNKILIVFDEKKSIVPQPKTKTSVLTESDFKKIEVSLGSKLDSIFIKFKHAPETVKEFLTQFQDNGFRVDSIDYNTIGTEFNSYVKNYIQSELLAREGYKSSLQNLPDVKKELKTWDDYYLSNAMRKKFYDSASVSDEQAYDFYTKNYDLINSSEEVNILEILSDNLDVISKVLMELKKGTDFRELATEYTMRDSLKDKGGEFGFFPITEHGEIGTVAANLKVGEVYGPIKTPEGYSLIKLIGKREVKKVKDKRFDEIKNDIKDILRTRIMDSKLQYYVADLALKYGVKINQDMLNSIPVMQINMMAFRMMGFGGRIYAVPFEPLFANWFNIYLMKKSGLLP